MTFANKTTVFAFLAFLACNLSGANAERDSLADAMVAIPASTNSSAANMVELPAPEDKEAVVLPLVQKQSTVETATQTEALDSLGQRVKRTDPNSGNRRCQSKGSCSSCLESGCEWTAGLCVRDCSVIADASCFSQYVFPQMSIRNICGMDAAETIDRNTCGGKTTCSSCTKTNQLGGSLCKWYKNGYCGTGETNFSGDSGSSMCRKAATPVQNAKATRSDRYNNPKPYEGSSLLFAVALGQAADTKDGAFIILEGTSPTDSPLIAGDNTGILDLENLENYPPAGDDAVIVENNAQDASLKEESSAGPTRNIRGAGQPQQDGGRHSHGGFFESIFGF